jgi:mono/diheme cytochrome c family protein
MQLLVSIIVLVLIALLFAWLATRAWRAHNAIVKWLGVVVSGLLCIAVLGVAIVALIGYLRITLPASNPVPAVQVTGTAEQRARGEHLASICAGCHSTESTLPLRGGTENFAAIPGGPTLGTIVGQNLTPGGSLRDFSDGELVRAIREGVGKNGRPLLVMPSEDLHHLSDADVQALVAYLRSQPAVENSTPPTQLNLLGGLIVGSGMFMPSVQPPVTQPVTSPPIGPTTEYGRYAVDIAGCRGCHGQNLTGGQSGGFAPAGPHIVSAAQRWTADQFVTAIRTGMTPEGRNLNPQLMPWKDISGTFTDEELRAIYAYLRTLPMTPPA